MEANNLFVAALNIGTTYSSCAYLTREEFKKDPMLIHTNLWEANPHQLGPMKTATCLLLNGRKEFLAFGYEAENRYAASQTSDGKHNHDNDYYFFPGVHMDIYKKKYINAELTFEDVTGKPLPALEVFKLSIKYFVSLLNETIQRRGVKVRTDNVQWVLTVPEETALTTKQFITASAKEAGIPTDNLMFVSEAKSSFVYCQAYLERGTGPRIQNGSECMVVDLGGCFGNIAVLKKEGDQISPKIYGTCNGSGSSAVNRKFFKVLQEIVGDTAMKYMREKDPSSYLDTEREFEMLKREVINDMTQVRVSMTIPKRTLEICRKINDTDFAVLLQTSKYANKMEFCDDRILIDVNTFKSLFQQTIVYIINIMEYVLRGYNDINSKNSITHISMVGGFAENSFVKQAVLKRFTSEHIIMPEDAGLAVVKGAVLCRYLSRPTILDLPSELLPVYGKLPGQKGLLLIINFKFPDGRVRKASEEDVRKLHEFFSELNYEVVCESDMTTEALKLCLQKIKYEYLTMQSTKYHCFICVTMSHGNQDGITTSDGTIRVDELVRPFKNDNAFSFIGKPKIFMIQACRGDKAQIKHSYVEPNRNDETDSEEIVRMPTDADIIKIYATTPGYYSYRRFELTPWNGSWFIQAFLKVARKHPKNHLLEILTAVNFELANSSEYEIAGQRCQLSMYEAALSKLFYF